MEDKDFQQVVDRVKMSIDEFYVMTGVRLNLLMLPAEFAVKSPGVSKVSGMKVVFATVNSIRVGYVI